MGLFDMWFGKKGRKDKQEQPKAEQHAVPPEPVAPLETLMTSQLPALYLHTGAEFYRGNYMARLMRIGFSEGDAQKMFDFECSIIRKHKKPYLLDPEFTRQYFFNLKQPFLQVYPKTKEEIYAERYFTMSELCKFIDEAEWHVWNSHERDMGEDVWGEIYTWRMKGPGIEFATKYFEMIENVTEIPANSIGELCAEQGGHLCRYKWK